MDLTLSKKKKRVGLLGGSFNPAHAGHLDISLFALKRLGLDEVWWLVSPQNPLKSKDDMAELAVRLASAQALVQHPNIKVTDYERELGTQYTVDTLLGLQARFPEIQFIWLMGADNFLQFTRWHRWQDLMNFVPIAVFRRPHSPIGRIFRHTVTGWGAAVVNVRRARNFAESITPSWLLLDNPLNPLSATDIRKKLGRK